MIGSYIDLLFTHNTSKNFANFSVITLTFTKVERERIKSRSWL
jgi:hypothetical protein